MTSPGSLSKTTPSLDAAAFAPVRATLRLEGAAAFAAAAAALYHANGFSWVWFAVLFLAPDLSMLAYLAGSRVGAFAYNVAHTYAIALPLALAGFFAREPFILAAALIWIAHIGFDRALGYGLKLAGFHDTHLGPIGRARATRDFADRT